MHLITLLNFNNEVYSFNFNGIGCHLTNSSQYISSKETYKWKNSSIETASERFALVGDGNYVIENDELIQQVAFLILVKIGTDNHYAVQRINFNNEFTIA